MKKINALLLVLAITFSSFLSATTNKNSLRKEKNPNKPTAIAQEVVNHLKKNNLILEEDVLTFVKFTLNDNHEMVVLSVDSENWEIDNFIKNRLNYKKLKSKSKSGMKTFIIPVRINASN